MSDHLPKGNAPKRTSDPAKIASYASGGLALLSLMFVFGIRLCWPTVKETIGYTILGLWVIGPPVWFWVEWVFFSQGRDTERLKHTHDLARNIWLALVVVLAAVLGVKWPIE